MGPSDFVATPTESYPRYSIFDNPRTIIGDAVEFPKYPIIEHMIQYSKVITNVFQI
jgi:hypothetical protein